MYLPKKKVRQRMNVRQDDGRVHCRPHTRWVATKFQCIAAGRGPVECYGPIDPHHVTTRGAGGGDHEVVPLCRRHHSMLDSPGWSQKRFEAEYNLDMATVAANLWQRSPHRIAWERKRVAA